MPTKTSAKQSDQTIPSMTLDERIFAIQQKLKPLGRNSEGFHYTYASYTSVWDDCLKPLCNKYHLLYSADAESECMGNIPVVVLHCSIRTVETMDGLNERSFTIPIPVGSDQKEVGKSLTYYRRYALLSLFGVSVLNDGEDADAYSGRSTPKPDLDPRMMAKQDNDNASELPDEPVF